MLASRLVTLAACVVVLAALALAGQCPGICQSTYTFSCSGTYQSGLCPGGSDVKCCPTSTPLCSGQCQQNTLYCANAYQSGKCPGSSSIQCCPSGASSPPPPPPSSGGFYKMSDSEARGLLNRAGIRVSSSGGCSSRTSTSCTALDQINSWTIFGIINFNSRSGCAGQVTITGGTETGHSGQSNPNSLSHWNGYKVDIRYNNCVDNVIQGYKYAGLRSDGAEMYTDSDSNVYAREASHWDILFRYSNQLDPNLRYLLN